MFHLVHVQGARMDAATLVPASQRILALPTTLTKRTCAHLSIYEVVLVARIPGSLILERSSLRFLLFREDVDDGRAGLIISQTARDFAFCDKLACMHGGVLTEYNNAEEVMADPRSFYARLVKSQDQPHLIDDGSRLNSPGDSLGMYEEGQKAVVAAPVFDMSSGGAHTLFKHPVAAGRHNQIYPQPDYI